MLLFALLAPILIAVTFPETAGRTLEEISPERELEPAALVSPSAAPTRPKEMP